MFLPLISSINHPVKKISQYHSHTSSFQRKCHKYDSGKPVNHRMILNISMQKVIPSTIKLYGNSSASCAIENEIPTPIKKSMKNILKHNARISSAISISIFCPQVCFSCHYSNYYFLHYIYINEKIQSIILVIELFLRQLTPYIVGCNILK